MRSREQPAIAGGKPIRNRFLAFGQPLIGQCEIDEVVDTLRSGWLGTGPKTRLFERAFAEYIGCSHAIALNSCTAGLHLGLEVLGIGRGDEVITTPMSFPSTTNVIVHRGAQPVFADIRRETLNLDPSAIESKITKRTKALLPVHMAGRPCEMDEISAIARRHGLKVIEDAAHAIESRYRGRKVGTISDLTAFSFYVTKNLCTGEGGMVTARNAKYAEQLRVKSLHGISRDAWKRYSSAGYQPYETLSPGYKYNMTDMQASLGIHQLQRLQANLQIREAHSKMYDKALADTPGILLIDKRLPPQSQHGFHLYQILLDLSRLRLTRNEFIGAMKKENIGTSVHFTALHLHRYYRRRLGYPKGSFPHAEWVSERTVSLPLSPVLTESDITDVIRAVKRLVNYFGRR